MSCGQSRHKTWIRFYSWNPIRTNVFLNIPMGHTRPLISQTRAGWPRLTSAGFSARGFAGATSTGCHGNRTCDGTNHHGRRPQFTQWARTKSRAQPITGPASRQPTWNYRMDMKQVGKFKKTDGDAEKGSASEAAEWCIY